MQKEQTDCLGCGRPPEEVSDFVDGWKCKHCGRANPPRIQTHPQVVNVITADPGALHQAAGTGQFLPIDGTELDARAALLRWMVSDVDMPDDILDGMSLKHLECGYFPHYLFTVAWQASWTDEVGSDYQAGHADYETRHGRRRNADKATVAKPRTDPQWLPRSSQVGGSEKVAVMATSQRPALASALELVCQTLWAANKLGQLCLTPSPGARVHSLDLADQAAYDGRVAAVIAFCARAKAYAAVPRERSRGFRCELTRQDYTTTRVYLPAWHAVYTYKGTDYAYCAPAWARHQPPLAEARPDDPQKREALEAHYDGYEQLRTCYTIGTVALAVVAAAIPVLSLCHYGAHTAECTAGYVVAGALAICAGVVGFTGMGRASRAKATAESNKEAHLARSLDARRRPLEEHLARLQGPA